MATRSKEQGQSPLRTKGQTVCIYHHGNDLTLFCETCEELACLKCLSTVHKGHDLCNLHEIIPERKDKLLLHVDEIRKSKLTCIEDIETTDQDLKDNTTQCQNLITEVKQQGEKVKLETDKLIDGFVLFCTEIEKVNLKALTSYKGELNTRLELLVKQIQDCQQNLQTGSDIQIFDFDPGESVSMQKCKPTLKRAAFIPNADPTENLKKAFGTMNVIGMSCEQNPQTSTEQQAGDSQQVNVDRPEDSTSGPLVQPKNRLSKSQLTKYKILRTVKLLTNFTSPCYTDSIQTTTDGFVWTSFCNSETTALLDKDGNIQKEIDCGAEVSNISVSPTTQNLWVCTADDSIMEYSDMTEKPLVRFKTDEIAISLCATVDDHIIVGMPKQITKFTKKGKAIQRTGQKGKFCLVATPHRITECKVTQNIAIVDKDLVRNGGKGRSHILILNSEFRELFRYRRNAPNSQNQTMKAPFDPSDVKYDSAGNLVVGDYDNFCLHLISGSSGKYIRLIYIGTEPIQTVGIDTNNVLWAGFGVGTRIIQLLKYSTE